MNQVKKFLALLSFCCLGFISIQAQEGIHATGGESSGSGGFVSYSVGQVFWNTVSGSNEFLVQGVQQPFEISEVTPNAVNMLIFPESNVYPNPTQKNSILLINSHEFEKFRFQLYDIHGRMILDRMVSSERTEIPMEEFSPSTYLLKIMKDGINIKTYKIVKY